MGALEAKHPKLKGALYCDPHDQKRPKRQRDPPSGLKKASLTAVQRRPSQVRSKRCPAKQPLVFVFTNTGNVSRRILQGSDPKVAEGNRMRDGNWQVASTPVVGERKDGKEGRNLVAIGDEVKIGEAESFPVAVLMR